MSNAKNFIFILQLSHNDDIRVSTNYLQEVPHSARTTPSEVEVINSNHHPLL